MTYSDIPALTGIQLAKLLEKNGWIECEHRTHGISMIKQFGDKTRVTIIPYTRESIPKGTLGAILGPKQTGIGRKGLIELLTKYR